MIMRRNSVLSRCHNALRTAALLGASVVLMLAEGPSARAACSDPLAEAELLATLTDQVVGFANAGDERLFVLRKRGIIEIWDGSQILAEPFLDIDDRVKDPNSNSDERGLLGLAFHPDFNANRFFFVHYIDNDDDSVIARFSRSVEDPDLADTESEHTVLTLAQPAGNHNGGALEFGPDGYLYIAFGDGGGSGDAACNAQHTDRWLGKLLRVDVDGDGFPADPGRNYGVPTDNPFFGAGDPLDEIWALGLRNPWRMSFDSATGDLWIGDVGQWAWEEISFQPAASPGGENYGWKVKEAHTCFDEDDPDCPEDTPPCSDSSYTDPVYSYSHSLARCSVVGGYRYRGGRKALAGCYVFGDYCTREIFAFDPESAPADDSASVVSGLLGSGLTAIGEDARGELYAAVENEIYSLTRPIFADGFETGQTSAWSDSVGR
jgi:glucose/arabinose dehydrogenase